MGDLEVEEPGCGLLDTYRERDAFSQKALVNLVESTSRMMGPFLLKRSPHFSPNLCGDVVRFYRFSSEKCLRYDIKKTGVSSVVSYVHFLSIRETTQNTAHRR
jgi:hypothetical protein